MTRRRSVFAVIAVAVIAALAALAMPIDTSAQLAEGKRAPLFRTTGALAGKPFAFDLAKQLKKGPVVLYFYPKAFTEGCTLEAHAFAEASGDFKKAGATVIGMSTDGYEALQKFSREACRDKFAVATATPAIVKAYGVDLKKLGVSTGLTTRTSFVIARNGRIVHVHSDMDYKDHVTQSLAAVRALKKAR
ncbi:peroxiredoxin [Sphingorhabdus soli]|uniref:thioredoxin-dependent peroxiredoxin n=1 Tax=Flavisphingopyxis soli TaxID=2601267 RepID=A0A5C6UMD9_9SPHN|nr:peroxiredoxin [Sphingorhabdus soli]TXC73690.1 peroxiredoxin [Sphingorhabdus soli]